MEIKTTLQIVCNRDIDADDKWVRVDDVKKKDERLMLFISAIVDDKDLVKDIRDMNNELSQLSQKGD